MYTHRVHLVNMTDVHTFCDNIFMDSMGERLRKARETNFASARKAAIRHGWTVSTYTAHENGQNDYDEETAREYGRAFNVSAGWLLTGEGPADRQSIVGVKGLVGAGGTIDTGPEQIPADGDLYQIEVPFPLPPDAFALQVRGESMFPRYDSGDVIVCVRRSISPNELVNREAAVETTDGSRYLKRLLKGSRKGLFDLESFNAPPIRGVRLQWASPVYGVVRYGEWHRIERVAPAKTRRPPSR